MSLKWLPNALTLLRIIAAPFVTLLLIMTFSTNEIAYKELYISTAFTLFAVAAATDWLDGVLARKLGATSELGAKLDLWADKIIVFAVLIGALFALPLLAVIGLVSLSARDLFIMRLRAKRPDVNLKASFLAKSKTAIIMAGMAIAMAGYAFTLQALRLDNEGEYITNIITRIGLSLYVFGCVLSLGTAYQYVNAALQQTGDSAD